ncbi:hypothetical protein LSAT2_021745 [Lamellibrachia satsuma]|nr:hypothetical protein LSAT2_021745 [Lamellibrachia satsuma]
MEEVSRMGLPPPAPSSMEEVNRMGLPPPAPSPMEEVNMMRLPPPAPSPMEEVSRMELPPPAPSPMEEVKQQEGVAPSRTQLLAPPPMLPGVIGCGSTGPAFRSRADRIQAIKDAATALKTRLNSEVKKMSHDLADDTTVEGKWAQPRPSDYSSRYDKIAGTGSDYRVFTTDLPGVISVAPSGRLEEGEDHQNEAATKIQAAYRGHTMRQDVRTKSSDRKQPQSQVDVAAELSDNSISSGDSTLTNERVFSSYPSVPFRQSTLDQQDFCAARRPMVPASHKHPDSVPMTTPLTWNKDVPDPDPFSVLNILARRQLHRVKAEKLRREREQTHHGGSPDDHLSHSRVTTDLSSHSTLAADQLNQRPAHSDHRSRSAHKDRSLLRTYSKSPRTLDDISTSYKDDFTAASSASAPALSAEGASRTAPSQSHRKMTHHSSPDKTITSEGDDTLEATLTPSDDSDDQGAVAHKSSRRSTKASAVTDGVSSRSLVVSGRVRSHTADLSDVSYLSSLGEEDQLTDQRGQTQVCIC